MLSSLIVIYVCEEYSNFRIWNRHLQSVTLKFSPKCFWDSWILAYFRFDTEAVVQRCFVKKVFLEISQNSQENTCARVSFSIKLQVCNFIEKETLALVFSCKFHEISKNTFLHRTPLVAASVWQQFYVQQRENSISL